MPLIRLENVLRTGKIMMAQKYLTGSATDPDINFN
ncbi:hypothetical protein SAMN05421777_104135 [Fluoribacter gormanii]|uniref:Uncharacterized protein n=1 Tax=Fluoribacter gormanii TaxID=464 RepID=A0A377GJ17_9GAMM|nr:hypothetical protein SAMN05421777_104135 [Fluoribacter gormanii]STO24738.1 Uncharacterised protein [Fluoribacter gormanii]